MGFRGRRRRPAWCLRRRQEQDSRDAMEGWMDVLSASDSVLIPEAAGSDGMRCYPQSAWSACMDGPLSRIEVGNEVQ